MSRDTELIALINLIYEAALDSNLWPSVLVRFADAVGAAQVAMPSMDWRANMVATIAPRFDPDLLASWQEYWAFHDPALARTTFRPAGELALSRSRVLLVNCAWRFQLECLFFNALGPSSGAKLARMPANYHRPICNTRWTALNVASSFESNP
jgi:hypothetical protein